MRSWIWIAPTLTLACGPMYQAPGGQPPPPPASATAMARPPGEPPPAGDPQGPPGGAPDDPYAGDSPPPSVQPPAPAPDVDVYAAVPSAEPATANRAAPRGEAAAWLEAHNRVRARHCAADLGWSAKLAEVAQRWANALRDRGCSFGHSGGSYGENLAAGTSGTLDPAAVVKMWYDEARDYRFPDGGFSMKTGHFTQVVWRGTTQVGCGRSQCKGMDIFVCEYSPAGNWEGQYRDNVRPRGCR